METKKFYHEKFVSFWLLSSISLIFLMIIVGGLTRLTNSGLSITEWELFRGILPPLSNDKWNIYFELYKKIPQFSLTNPTMTMSEFKIIFYWEYLHRLFGRFIGLFYIIPLVYFTFKKLINIKLLVTLYLVFFLIIFQGILGWYMVKSGLVNNITVSHYRLSLHLLFAFIIISILFWTYLNYNYNENKIFFNYKNKLIKLLFILIFFQIVIGAFVSGLDAGLIYQTWPKMNFSYFPDDLDINNIFFLSIFNNQSFVQFLHRSIAYIIFAIVLFLGFKLYLVDKTKYIKSYFNVFFVLILQISLGIFTLISGLNLFLASLHQIFSVILVFTVLNLNHKFS